jgi:16S rRNA (guanine527-N7)-methyltransferase
VTEDEAKRVIAADVSRETLNALETYVQILRRWQPKLNLVANATLDSVWSRHILDSLQLLRAAPVGSKSWLDLGSGGGFPGLPCAICAADYDLGTSFELVESDTRKCAFLREVVAADWRRCHHPKHQD